MNTRNGCRGITLVELCFGLAIVGLLAGMAVPSMRTALVSGAIRSATLELAAGIQQARASSIVEARPAMLCLSDSSGACQKNNGPATAWRAFVDQDGRESTLVLRTLPAGVVLFATRPKLTFWPDSLSASTVTLTICDSRGDSRPGVRPRAIVLSQAGRARFTDAPADGCRA